MPHGTRHVTLRLTAPPPPSREAVRGVLTTLALMLVLALASACTPALLPAQTAAADSLERARVVLDSVRLEAVRSRAQVRGSDTQLTLQ